MNINILPILPEIFLTCMICVILLAGALVRQRNFTFYLSQLSLLVTFGVLVFLMSYLNLSQPLLTFNDNFVVDWLSQILKVFILLCVFLTFLYSGNYNRDRRIPSTEFYVLGLLSTIGMMMLVSSHTLLMIFLGVELVSLPTYAMVAMRREEVRCIEAGMKYFIIGALASGMLLYGFSMIFGVSQQVDIARIANYFTTTTVALNYIGIFGLVFAVCGLAFKLGAAPFHMWVPDVYDGAPNSVTLFISTAPKIAGFGMAIRLLVGALPELHVQWQEMLIVISIASMAVGNFAAIVQTNFKRLLAYSSVAHAGYSLLGIITGTPHGYAVSMFYVLSYAIMSLVAFGMLTLLSRAGFEVEHINDFKALNNRYPWLAFLILMVMFSLAGVPPLVGFFAKIGLLEALITVHMVWLAVVAILFAIVGAYYYIRVVKVMYFEPLDATPTLTDIILSKGTLIAISINAVAVLILGILPGKLFYLCSMAFTGS